MKTIVLLLLSLGSFAAAAGGNSGGGGVVIVCSDHVYLADTFPIVSSFTNKNLLKAEPYQVEVAIAKVVEQRYPQKIYSDPSGGKEKVSMATMLNHFRKTLVYEGQEAPLPLLGDDYIDESTLPAGCKKQQVAIQDIPSHRVTFVASLRKQMSSLEQGLLSFHESVVSLRNQPGADTTPIRALTQDLMQNELNIFVAVLGSLNYDCQLFVQSVHGCHKVFPEESDPCQQWDYLAPVGQGSFTRTSQNRYELQDHEFSVAANVIFNGKNAAKISIQAPGYSKEVRVKAKSTNAFMPEFRDAQYTTEVVLDASELNGLRYNISCSFGLGDKVQTNLSNEEKEMNKLGPPEEWIDPVAASLALLPVGTVLELTSDLDVELVREQYGHPTSFFVEGQRAPVTDVTFHALRLPYRFAFAEFFNANNGYLEKTHYPAGMKIEVTSVEVQHLESVFHPGRNFVEYTLKFKTISSPMPLNADGKEDPITWMRVDGRRSGRGDVKIPQFAEMLKSRFKVILPGGVN